MSDMTSPYRDEWDEEGFKERAWGRIEPMEGHGPPSDSELTYMAHNELEGVLGRIAYAVDAGKLDESEANIIFGDILRAQKILEESNE